MEISGQQGGDSAQPLTIWSAAEAIAGLPDDDEVVDSGDSDTRETAQPETAPEGETSDEEVESGEPEASDDTEDQAGPDDVEESDDEQPETPSTQAPQKLKAKVNGQEIEITPEEAVAGYQRQQDYSRKTMELSEARRKFEQEEMPAVRAKRQKLHTALTQVEEYLNAVTQEPDWDTLKQDPAVFAQVHAAWQVHEKRLNALQQNRQQLEAEMLADQQTQTRQKVAEEQQKLLTALPSWNDAEVAKKEAKEVFDYATSTLGVTPDEFRGISDHRVILAVRKAMLYDRAEAAKVEAAKKAAPKIDKVRTVAPGPSAKAKAKPQVTEFVRRKQRLAKTGSVRDAAAALEMMPDDE